MNVLLDTCVISELQHPKGSPKVKQRIAKIDEDALFLSALSVGEIAKGIGLMAPGSRRQELGDWLLQLEQDFASRILFIDNNVARLWGQLTARAQLQGIVIPAADGLVAATALRHGLCLITRNTRHFAHTGAQILDPWE